MEKLSACYLMLHDVPSSCFPQKTSAHCVQIVFSLGDTVVRQNVILLVVGARHEGTVYCLLKGVLQYLCFWVFVCKKTCKCKNLHGVT